MVPLFISMQSLPLQIVITRGEFDAIAVNQSTGIPAVALPGGTFLPPEVCPWNGTTE